YQPNMGMVVGYCEQGDWMKYSVKVAEDGEYEISALVAGDNSTGSFVLYMDDKQIGTEIVNEGLGFTEFTTVKGGTATLTAGEHELKLEITNSWIDIDYVEFTKKESEKAPEQLAKKFSQKNSLDMGDAQYFDMRGHRIGKTKARTLGTYLVRIPGVKSFIVHNEK
ncbi:MAG: carbohydrate-binding protein, partial [Fibrobacter sp.]|nr:carbohydrate-binding protein [Fibrobacter sp.]